MTKQRSDSHSTEFGLWLRQQKEIDSKLGFLATNLDFIWTNYKTGEWMLIEEKRYSSVCKQWQKNIFQTIHKACKSDPKYKGIHFLQFEKTNPEDGKIFWDKKEITKQELIDKLGFKV